MKLVEWKDQEGYMRRRSVKNGDPQELWGLGIPEESPSMELLNWDDIKRDIHNQLMSRKLYTFHDVQRSQNGVTAAVQAAIAKKIVALYREQEKETRRNE